jgi:hypothetical protein
MVGVSVDTMMVSTKPLMDTIADVGDGRGPSGSDSARRAEQIAAVFSAEGRPPPDIHSLHRMAPA